jgi:S-methylmethionine-dependent homocysteine/selenocysteine methylase
MVSWDSLLNKLKAKFKELEEEFEEEKSKECIQARDAIVRVLKENHISLPAAIFALEIGSYLGHSTRSSWAEYRFQRKAYLFRIQNRQR